MRFLLLLLIAVSLFATCSDVIIPDISGDNVLLTAPANGTSLTGSTVTFAWEHLPDAIDYELEVVRPGFDSIQVFAADTFTAARSLTLALEPGDYEWRVTAYNEAYASACCMTYAFSLQSDSAADLADKLVILLNPPAGVVTNAASITFNWQSLALADQYRIQLSETANFSSVLQDEELSTSSVTYALEEEGELYWRVRAESSQTNTFTNWSSRQFATDFTAPAAPILNAPEDGATLDISAQAPDLSWQAAGDTVSDSLYIYEDAFLSNLFLKLGTTDTVVDLDTVGASFSAGSYYWQVRSLDVAGNVSSPSSSRQFMIQ